MASLPTPAASAAANHDRRMSMGIGKLRGAVSKVMTDNQQQQTGARPDIWTELARGMKLAGGEERGDAATTAAAAAAAKKKGKAASKRKMMSLVDHLDSVFNKPTDKSEGDERVEEVLQLHHLEKLKSLFEERESASGAGGKGEFSLDEFKEVVAGIVGHDGMAEQLERIFYKLDTDNNGFASWTEFCNYMMLYLSESDRLSFRVEPPFKAEPRLRQVMHNRQEPTARLMLTNKPTRPMSVTKLGCILLWDCLLKLEAHLDTQAGPTDLSSSNRRLFTEWVMDAVHMSGSHKLVLSTSGREIKFFDIASNVIKEEYSLYGLRSVPVVLKYHQNRQAGSSQCQLLAGDDSGDLHVLTFRKPLQQLFDLPPDPNHRSQRVWFQELGRHAKFVEAQHFESLHPEAINDLVYMPDTSCVCSCSSSPSSSVLVYSLAQRSPVYTFRIRRGADCFDVCRATNLIVTGSPDHLVRLWNPYVPARTVAVLEGHNNSVLSVLIHQKLGCVISYARDAVIKVWDIRAYVCVQTVAVRLPYTVADRLPEHLSRPLTLHLPSSTVYLTVNDYILQYRLGKAADPVPGLVLTHKEQLCCAAYNPTFQQVTTAADDSSMATWDLGSGAKCLAFANAHEGEEITCVAFDWSLRRLLTGTRLGQAKVWSCQNGQLLHVLRRTAESEITGIVSLASQERFLTVGWSRHIVCYSDTNPDITEKKPVRWRGGVLHEDDILTCDFCPPELLATASYDGAILVWNVDHEKLLVQLRQGFKERVEKKAEVWPGQSGPEQRVCSSSSSRLSGNSRPNSRHRRSHQQARRPAPVDKLLFLRRRFADKRQREGGLLLSSDAGTIRCWSLHGSRRLLAEFYAPAQLDECVLAVATDSANQRLFTGDTCGGVRCWSIGSYAIAQCDQTVTAAPPCIAEFRAHDAAIVSVDIAEVDRGVFVVTASVDRTAKLFSADGDLVGTFGQPKLWDLGRRKTWKQAQLDREKFFQEVSAIGEENEEQPMPKDEPSPFVTAAEGSRPLQHARSHTMPEMPGSSSSSSSSSGHKAVIGIKAERNFERMRSSRSDRRQLFGDSARRAATASGPCCPYIVLRTTEFKPLSLSSNLPKPSWALRKSKTTLEAASQQQHRQGRKRVKLPTVAD